MTERPILFSGPMIRALLDNRKTQTRRVIKPQPEFGVEPCYYCESGFSARDEVGRCMCTQGEIRCPYQVGTRLWVRETWAKSVIALQYRADNSIVNCMDPRLEEIETKWGWRPSIFMPRWASRIALEVTGVRVERLQDISEEDAKAEDVAYRCDYKVVWDEINGKKYPWSSNPWVWRIEFKREEASCRHHPC